MNEKHTKNPIEIGDRVVVSAQLGLAVVVKKIIPENGITRVILDWGVHGTSRVFAHDEGYTWYRYDWILARYLMWDGTLNPDAGQYAGMRIGEAIKAKAEIEKKNLEKS